MDDYTVLVKNLSSKYSDAEIKEMFSIPQVAKVHKINRVFRLTKMYQKVNKFIESQEQTSSPLQNIKSRFQSLTETNEIQELTVIKHNPIY